MDLPPGRPAGLWEPALLLGGLALLGLAVVGRLQDAFVAVAAGILCAVPCAVPCVLSHGLVALVDRWLCPRAPLAEAPLPPERERLLPIEGPLLLVAVAVATAQAVLACS